MGSPTELGEVPQRTDGDITPAGSKAESVNMDLYINPAAERKMMLKFDVSNHAWSFCLAGTTQMALHTIGMMLT